MLVPVVVVVGLVEVVVGLVEVEVHLAPLSSATWPARDTSRAVNSSRHLGRWGGRWWRVV